MKNWALVTFVAPILWGQSDYKESDPLPGKTLIEKLSRVSQLDRLTDTKSDAARCSCAAGVSAFLLLGGQWEGLATKYGLPSVPTYESMHRLQDRLYQIANVDGMPGVFGGCRPLYNAAKRVTGWERKPGDEVHLLFEELGIENWPLYGPTEEKLNDRKAAVQEYFEQYPEGALIVGVNEDTKTSESLPVKPGTFASHYVVVFQRNGSYFRLDSWAQPGEKTLHPMNEKQVRELVFETPVTLLATKLKPASRL